MPEAVDLEAEEVPSATLEPEDKAAGNERFKAEEMMKRCRFLMQQF